MEVIACNVSVSLLRDSVICLGLFYVVVFLVFNYCTLLFISDLGLVLR